jgi:hypothetical protein
MIRMFQGRQDSAVKARTQTINQLRAILARAEPSLRESLAGLGLATLIRRCAELPDINVHDIGTAANQVLRTLARRITDARAGDPLPPAAAHGATNAITSVKAMINSNGIHGMTIMEQRL